MKQVLVPDIGDYKGVSVIEVMVKVGDTINTDDTLLTLETDKAAMDVPSPFAGVVKELHVEIGDKVSKDSLILVLESNEQAATPAAAAPVAAPATAPVAAPVAVIQTAAAPVTAQTVSADMSAHSKTAHASPAIRRFARELGVDIARVSGSGEKGRVTKEDVQNFVKASLAQPRAAAGGNGLQVLDMPVFDFAKFGAIET
ncbi:MAG: biotin/lipoyl-containing protein, partial [Gallionella sp.]